MSKLPAWHITKRTLSLNIYLVTSFNLHTLHTYVKVYFIDTSIEQAHYCVLGGLLVMHSDWDPQELARR